VIRLVLVGLWVCAVTLGSGYAAVSWQSGRLVQADTANLFGGLSTVTTRLISVPVIADGTLHGYVVAQFAFAADSSLLRQLSVKPDLILVDEAIRTIYSSNDFDFRQMARQNLPALTKTLAANVNARIGAKLVEDVLIEELNYITKDQVRAKRK